MDVGSPQVTVTGGAVPSSPTQKKQKKVRACFAPEVGEEETRNAPTPADSPPEQPRERTFTDEVKKRQSQRVSKHHGSQISMDDFKQWTRSCGVFKIQHEYELLAEDARSRGITIEEEMKEHNFKNYEQFARSCDRFALNCWPGDFAELGSGFVLYYHFLVFLGVVLVMTIFAQLPALIYYSGYDNVQSWYFHEQEDTSQNQTAPSGMYLGQWTLTPGNLGPDAGDNAGVLLSYMVLLAIICLLFVGEYQHQQMQEKRVDNDTTTPNDFAIVVKGLPESAVQEADIKKFFSKHAIAEKPNTEIVKVVIGWDADGFRDEKQELEHMRKQKAKAGKGSPEAMKIKNNMEKIEAELYASVAKRELESSGVVIISFRYQKDMRACLARWNGFWPYWLNRETEDLPCLPRGNRLKFGAKLPRFPISNKDEPPVCLQVQRAPNPGDIEWEKLGIDPWTRYTRMATTNLIMIAMVFGAFWATWYLQTLKEDIREKSANESGSDYYLLSLLSLVPGLGVAVMNTLLSTVARKFGEREFHDSTTEREFSISFKMCLAMLINTSGVMVWTHWDPKEWYAYGGLVEDVLWVMIVDGVLYQFFGFLDLEWIFKCCDRRAVTEERCAQWTQTMLENCVKDLSKENKEVLSDLKTEVMECRQAFEPMEVDMSERFASAVNSFVFCFIFTPVLPLLPVLGLLGVILQYWCDKVLLLRWQKRPSNPQNSSLAVHSLVVVKGLAPAFWCTSVFMYLRPSWNDDGSQFTWFFLICLLSSMFISIVPLHLWALIICRPCCVFQAKSKKLADESFEDYYNAQAIWPIPYHRDQPLYAGLPEEKNPKILREGQDYTLSVADYNLQEAAVNVVATSDESRATTQIGAHRITTHGYDWTYGAHGGYAMNSSQPVSPWQNPMQSTPPPGHGVYATYGKSTTQGGYGHSTTQGFTAPPPTVSASFNDFAPQGAHGAHMQANAYGSNPAAYGYNTNNTSQGWTQGSNMGYGGYNAPLGTHAVPPTNQMSPVGAYGAPAAVHSPTTGRIAGGNSGSKSFNWPAATCNRFTAQSCYWEFDQNGAFQAFPWASQSELETKYQAFVARQAGNVASMNINGMAYTIDFNYMTMTGHGYGGQTHQRINRRATE